MNIFIILLIIMRISQFKIKSYSIINSNDKYSTKNLIELLSSSDLDQLNITTTVTDIPICFIDQLTSELLYKQFEIETCKPISNFAFKINLSNKEYYFSIQTKQNLLNQGDSTRPSWLSNHHSTSPSPKSDQFDIYFYQPYFDLLNENVNEVELVSIDQFSENQMVHLILEPNQIPFNKNIIPSDKNIKEALQGIIIDSHQTGIMAQIKLRDGICRRFKLLIPLRSPFHLSKIGSRTSVHILYDLPDSIQNPQYEYHPELFKNCWFSKLYSKSIQNIFALFHQIGSLDNFKTFGLPSFLVEGPSGSGKTYLLNQLKHHFNFNLINISAFEFVDSQSKTSYLAELLGEALRRQPCLVIIDHLEQLFPKSNADSILNETLLELIHSMSSLNPKIILAGVTTDTSLIHPTVASSFLIKFNLEPPELDSRISWFEWIAQRNAIAINHITNMKSFSLKYNSVLPYQMKSILQFSHQIVEKNLIANRDSSDPTELQTIETVNWSDIGGLEHVKISLKESIILNYERPETLKKLNMAPTKGILLYGPPGTGKTLLAKAVATECSARFISVSIPTLIQSEVGESEKTVSRIFDKAKLYAPSVIFLDEVECAFGTRTASGDWTSRLVSQLILELDALDGITGITVLAATNHPERIDRSLLRSGRIDKLIYIPPPDLDGRISIITTLLKKRPIATDVDILFLADQTTRFSGADLRALSDRASLCAFQRVNLSTPNSSQNIEGIQLTQDDFNTALLAVTPSVSERDLIRLEQFSKQHFD